MKILEDLRDMAKSMYDNDIYGHIPQVIFCDHRDREYIEKGKTYAFVIDDFEGYGDTIEDAFKAIAKNYKEYINNETEFEDKMMSYFEDLNV